MQREHAQVTNMTGFRKDKNNHADFLMHAQYSGHGAVVFIVLRHLPDMTNQMESERAGGRPGQLTSHAAAVPLQRVSHRQVMLHDGQCLRGK